MCPSGLVPEADVVDEIQPPRYTYSMNHVATRVCSVCGSNDHLAAGELCPILRAAAREGAQPPGVPLRIYGGYIEARVALKQNASANAANVLQWLLEHLAEQRGVPAESSFATKLQHLCDEGAIAPRVREALFDLAMSTGPHRAWALMSISEHALSRVYMQASRS